MTSAGGRRHRRAHLPGLGSSHAVRAIVTGARMVTLDVCDGAALDEECRSFRPELVLHLAAQIDVRVSMDEPARDVAVNLTAEHYARWFHRVHGLDVLTLRYGNVYGPRQDPRNAAGVIAVFCDRALAGRKPIIYGDGRQTRDYVFVADIVTANLAAARAVELSHSEYNVGTGTEITVLELATAVAAADGVDPADFQPNFAPARPGELHRSCLDVTWARCDLALPAPTPLPEGLAATVDWVRTMRMSRQLLRSAQP